jgi:hypothetical protein
MVRVDGDAGTVTILNGMGLADEAVVGRAASE